MALPGQPSGMSQTSFIFASVFVAYLVFITLRGDLAKWLGVFGFSSGGGAPSGSTPSGTAATGTMGSSSGLPPLSPLPPLSSGNMGSGV
jgi:hypothetical protein